MEDDDFLGFNIKYVLLVLAFSLIIYLTKHRKRFTDKENQDILKRVRDEMKTCTSLFLNYIPY